MEHLQYTLLLLIRMTENCRSLKFDYLQYTLLLLIPTLKLTEDILNDLFTIHFATINTINRFMAKTKGKTIYNTLCYY